MKQYQKITLQHANLNKPVHLVVGTIAGWHYSDKAQCVYVYTTGGIFPVSNTEDEIDQKLNRLNEPETSGGN